MNTAVMFSSATDMWATPISFFRALDAEFHFDVDVCATKENAKCARFFTQEQDGLKQEWTGTVWCNPPYGREIGKWVSKGYASTHTHTHTHRGHRCYASSCANRYKVVSRIHLRKSGDPLCARSAQIRRCEELCAVSVNGCDMEV